MAATNTATDTAAARTTVALPKPKPFVGHFATYGKDPLGFVTRLANEIGGVVPVRMGPIPGLVVSDPAAIEEVLVTRNRDFRKSFATRRIGVVMGNGILVSDGEKWREHRSAIQPAFHSERIAAWAQAMTQEALATTERWRDGQTIDIHREMYELSLRIVVRTLLDGELTHDEVRTVAGALDEGTAHFDSRYNGVQALIPDFLPTLGNLRLRRAVKVIDRILYRLIEKRRRAIDHERHRPDVISMLLETRRRDGKPLTDREVRDEVITLFLSGHETMALALTWGLYLLARNPAKQACLRAELEFKLRVDAVPTVADMSVLSYTEAVVNETFRLYPPAYAVNREAIRPTVIGNHKLAKRHLVLVSIYAAHRNAEHFAEPDQFIPERWLDGLAERLPRGAFVPFAEGPRKCVGSSFAMQEAILTLATICSRVQMSPTSDHEPRLRPAITLRPAEPVLLRVADSVTGGASRSS